MVLDDQPMQAARHQRLGIAQAGVVQIVYRRPAIARCAGKRRAMDHSDQNLFTPEDFAYRAGTAVGYGLHQKTFRMEYGCDMRAFVIGNVALDET